MSLCIVVIYDILKYLHSCNLCKFFFNVKVAIMVHITYRHAQQHFDGVESTLEDRQIVCEYHFYMSDDRSHSAEFVYSIVLVCMMISCMIITSW
mgnify:CR=1 FL=1